MSSKGSLLLVDDEPIVLEMFKEFLEHAGYNVVTAAKASEALGFLERGNFDAFICDVTLDEFDGFDLLMIARKKIDGVGVVLITGAPYEPDSKTALSQNAVYLSKPIGADSLILAVEKSIELTKSEAFSS